MAYNIELPDGTLVTDIPDELSPVAAKQRIIAAYPQYAPKPVPPSTERTFGEAITDPLLSLVKGTGSMAQLPGQLYGLATGDFDTAAMRGPAQLQEYAKSLQSKGLQAREALRDQAMSDAEKRGIAAEFYTAITQTLKDPALISTFITETIPEMIPMLVTGGASKLFTTGVSQVAKLGAKEAAENAAKVALRTGIATGAVQQGADVGSDTYVEALELARAQYPNKSPSEIQDIALNAARATALESGIVSLGAQFLPGAKAIERRLAGIPGEGRIRSGLGEAAGEMLEEGGGKFASNVNLQQIDPERSLTAGVGSAAGLGAIGGGAMGAVIGRRAPEPELMPGQNYGESLAQAANRLQAEIRENQKLIQPVERAITAVTQAPVDPVVAPFINPPQGSLFSEGNLNVGTANAAPGGEGTLLAGVPGTGGTAAGVAATQPDGVVPTGQDVAGTAGGEGAASTSVEPVVLQNRNRATPPSIAQMQDISARPDYTRLGFSRDITTGAPVVFGGNIPTQQLGKADVVAAGDKKIPVQYAVMDVNDVIASNNADGSIVPEYSTAVDKTRVVGGNARIAGLQNAYKNNTAAGYVTELLGDDLHGISPDVIKGVKNPVLVRVMPASEVTKNIGDITNTTGTLELSTVDQAKNDIKRVDVNDISYTEDGDVTDYSVMQFIRSMPATEHGKLIDDDGKPSQIARMRLHAAIFSQAYQNDRLLRLYAQAVDSDAKNVLNALSQAAPQMARLQGAGALDFRNDVVAAAEQIVTAKKAGISTPDMVAQVTMDEDPNVHNILTGLANNIRSAKRMARILKEAANYAYHHANTEEQDMFGEPVPKPTKEDITQGIKEGKEYPKQSKRGQKGQIDLGLTAEEEQQNKAKAQFERVATAEAPARIAEKKEQFKNILGKILSNMGLKDVAVKLMDDIESEKAEGSYAEKLIKIALNAEKPVRTLRHEAIHALKELGFFSDNQWKVLTKQANDVWIDKYLKNRGVGGGPLKEGEQSRYDAYMEGEEFKADPNAIIEEAIADAFGDFDATKSPPGMIQAILKRMNDFFAGLKRALSGAGFLTSDQAVEQLFGKIARGELKAGTVPQINGEFERLSLSLPKDYQGEHTPPTKDSGSPIHDLKDVYPDDLYGSKGAQYYGHYGQNDKKDVASVEIMRRLKDRPNQSLTIYRAVPKSAPSVINPGDWVTINRDYAKEHGESALNGDYKIINKLAHSRDIFTNGDSIHEWGYEPQPMVSKEEAKEKGQKFSLKSVPNEPGTESIPKGHVRLYHQTDEDSLEKIAKEGLSIKHAKGIEGPRAIYAGETPFYGSATERPTLEFHVPKDQWDSPFVLSDVTPDKIIAAHQPWHNIARYLEGEPKSKEKALSGEFDDLEGNYKKAIDYIKEKYKPAKLSLRAPNTKEFKQFFGDSKVVDENGDPLVVYHGTAQSLIGGAFSSKHAKSEGLAFYFSHSPLMKNPAENANDYAKNRLGEEQQVMPVYLSIENPLVVGFTEPMPTGDAAIEKWLDRMGKFNRSIDMSKEQYFQKAIREAKKSGHDGVIVRNIEDVANDVGKMFTEETDVYIAFEPTQIKSATGNIGTYDKKNPDIRYSLRNSHAVAKKVARQLNLTEEEINSTVLKLRTGLGGDKAFDTETIGKLPAVVDYLQSQRLLSGLPPLDVANEDDRTQISRLMAAEALAAIDVSGKSLEWYDQTISKTLGMMALRFPELKRNVNARMVFRLGMAITSQNLNVVENLKFAIKQYESYRNSKVNGVGKFPEMGSGKNGNAMISNFIMANAMIKEYGENTTRRFLETSFTVKELRAAGFNISGELGTENILGSSIFGPKIGFGFYSNLSGNFDPVTMDMWFMRTIGRLTGKLRLFNQNKFDAQLDKFRNSFEERGEEGIFADEFSDDLVESAKTNVDDAVKLARVVMSVHEGDYKNLREFYTEKIRKKSTLVLTADRLLQSIDKPRDVPANGTERRQLRDVVAKTLAIVKEKTGKDIPAASMQALIWYPEQELYKSLGVRLKVTSTDYAKALNSLLTEGGYSGTELSAAGKSGSRFVQRLVRRNEQTGDSETGQKPERPNALTGEERTKLLTDRKKPKLSLRDKLGLYSELENKIEAVGPNQAPAPQWKAMIKGMVQKGVKPEEIEWSGVNDYLDLQEGKVPKAALLEYLKEGGVKVEETTLQETAPLKLTWKLVKNDDFKEYYETTFTNYRDEIEKVSIGLKPNGKWWIYGGNDDANTISLSKNDAENYAVSYIEENAKQESNSPKYNYGQLILPGGTNYREVLLTLSPKPIVMTEAEARKVLGAKPDAVLSQADLAYAANKNNNDYKSNHWDKLNVLAHIRINDRVDVDGKKVLFVEEVQSDWGQEGKREGFISDLTPITPTEWETIDRHEIYNTREEAEKDIDTYPPAGGGINYYSLGEVEYRYHIRLLPLDKKNRYEIVEQVRTLAIKTGVFPKAPFVTKTEGWLNLALKRIMVLAAEGNYDKVAFINGKQSAKRYNLADYIDSIDYEKDDQGTYEFVATDKEGRTVYSKEEISLSEIEILVGKDIAKKIEAGEGDTSNNESSYNNWHTLSNVDLEVGEGKGMKVFYDQIVPIALKKLLPKVGGKELITVDIKEPFTLRNVLHQPGFDVTPEMKQKVETTGLPKFSLRNTFSGQINAAVDRTTTFREETKWGDKLLGWLSPTSKSEFRAAMINRYNELGIYDRRRAEKMGGFGLLADASAESAALFSDLGSSLTAAIMGPDGGAPVYANGITTVSNFGGTVKGPLEIFAELERLGKGDIEIYRYYQVWAGVKRAERLMPSHANPQGTEINFKQSDIPLAKEIEKRFPEFVAIQKEWIKYNDKLAQYLVDTGVIGKEAKKEWVKYGDYVPFYRQVNDIETVGPKLLQAIAGVKGPKKIKGDSTAPLADFLETVIRNTQAAVQMGVKNVAAQRAVLVAMDLNAPGKTDVIEPLNFVSSKPDTVTILVDGQQRSFRSNDTLWLSAITSLNLPDVPFVGVFTGPANLLRALVTKDPGFMLANMMRDSMQAMIASDYKTVNPATTLMNFAATLAGSSPEFKALMNAGVVGGNDYTKDIVHSGKAFAKDLRKAAGQMTTAETLLSPVTGLWDALERGTTASDAATREQIYKEVLKRTTSPAYPNGNMAEAIYRAMEVMNFNRKGNSAIIRFLTGAIPFFNARIQGLDVLYRAGFGIGPDKKSAAAIQKQFFIRGATMFAMSCMYWTMTHDDDDYKNQEQETKDNYWLLPSLGVKIPIPFEVGILFKVIPERIMAAYFGTDTADDFTRSMKRQLINTLDVNWLMPQTVKPFLETVTNHSFFTDRPIIGQGMETIEEGYQAGANTSKIAADIGKAVGYSPMKIDHLVSGYTGTMGMYAFNLLDAIYKMNDDKTYASKRFEQTPVLKRFLIDPNARGTVTAYYETKNAADSAVRTAALMERTMNYAEWGPYYKENIKVIATHEYLLDLEKTMKELREMRMQIVANKAEPDEKRDALANLNRVEAKLTANIQIVKKNMK